MCFLIHADPETGRSRSGPAAARKRSAVLVTNPLHAELGQGFQRARVLITPPRKKTICRIGMNEPKARGCRLEPADGERAEGPTQSVSEATPHPLEKFHADRNHQAGPWGYWDTLSVV